MKSYQLPHAFYIGKAYYTVRFGTAQRQPPVYGSIVYAARHINIIKTVGGVSRKPRDVRGTFWHEVTHAVLAEMKSDLAFNETFVSAFASRLHNAIETAEFDK